MAVSFSPINPALDAANSLTELIHAASRSTHAQLNRLITARLLLALPPYATTTSQYVTGLLRISPLFIAFESAWESSCSPLPRLPCFLDSDDGTRVQSILAYVHLPGLLRSRRLRADLQYLSGGAMDDVEDQLTEYSKYGVTAELVKRIRWTAARKPHALLAYAWVLYMAIFSGGRFLVAMLQHAGSEFWKGTSSPSNTKSDGPLQFFMFDGDKDGEDIKLEFKNRFAHLDLILTGEEKGDILDEAQNIFRCMVQIIAELDGICGSRV